MDKANTFFELVSERKVRVLNEIKIKNTRPETITTKRHKGTEEEGRRETHKGRFLTPEFLNTFFVRF